MIRDGSGHRRISCAGERREEMRSADALLLLRSSVWKSATCHQISFEAAGRGCAFEV